MSRFNSGRDSFEPEMPRSTYSLKTAHPRREAYSRSSDSCISGLCPLHVETLAYRATRPLDRLYAVVVDSALSDRLKELRDGQIGQLVFAFCSAECYFNSPELTIVNLVRNS